MEHHLHDDEEERGMVTDASQARLVYQIRFALVKPKRQSLLDVPLDRPLHQLERDTHLHPSRKVSIDVGVEGRKSGIVAVGSTSYSHEEEDDEEKKIFHLISLDQGCAVTFRINPVDCAWIGLYIARGEGKERGHVVRAPVPCNWLLAVKM